MCNVLMCSGGPRPWPGGVSDAAAGHLLSGDCLPADHSVQVSHLSSAREDRLRNDVRSHEVISGWSSQHFYSGHLSAHPSNASIGLEQLLGNTGQYPLIGPLLSLSLIGHHASGLLALLSSPLTWLDTRNAGPAWEEEEEGEDSLANTGEAVTSLELVTRLLVAGLSQENIGVISPYWAQVATIRSVPSVRSSTDAFDLM